MDAGELADKVRSRLSEPLRERLGTASETLAERIAIGMAGARERWSEAPAAGEEFAAYLALRLAAQPDPVAALPRLRVDDLFLAWWAGRGDPRGISAFEAAHAGDLARLVQRFHRLPADELKQRLRVKLFVGTGEAPPSIQHYSGFGFLQNWLRVTAARSFLDAARADESRLASEELDEELLLGAADPIDPRLEHVRRELGAAVKQAFAQAVAELSPRARTFLRHAHVDQLTLDQIASVHRVHRATVARILAQARAELLEGTRARVAGALRIGDDELGSVVKLLDSRLDLSLSRVLRGDGPIGTPP